ncbi:magnesium ion transporter [Chytridiales sp. JEL 0842]|nr:magnesium ion transporter [Chytridiales sp. JEL 0842]
MQGHLGFFTNIDPAPDKNSEEGSDKKAQQPASDESGVENTGGRNLGEEEDEGLRGFLKGVEEWDEEGVGKGGSEPFGETLSHSSSKPSERTASTSTCQSAASEPDYEKKRPSSKETTSKEESEEHPDVPSPIVIHTSSSTDSPTINILQSSSGKSMLIRGVVFDSKGEVTILDKQYLRAQFCSLNSLQPRDLRKIDSSASDQFPVILVREKAILVNLSHIRALVKSDSVILFTPDDPSPTVNSPPPDPKLHQQQSAFIHELQGKLQSKDIPHFELRAVEAILVSVLNNLQTELDDLVLDTDNLLTRLNSLETSLGSFGNPASIDSSGLKNLLLLRRRSLKFSQRVESIRNAIVELLHNDEDLAGMYITDKSLGKPRQVSDHMDAELMLEHYLKLLDEIFVVASQTSSNLQTTQQMIGITLDSERNALIVYDLKANLATVAISTGALVAGLFGMNLTSGVEEVKGLFWAVVGLAMGGSVGVFWGSVRRVGRGGLRGLGDKKELLK